jgi:hypothetical protein
MLVFGNGLIRGTATVAPSRDFLGSITDSQGNYLDRAEFERRFGVALVP